MFTQYVTGHCMAMRWYNNLSKISEKSREFIIYIAVVLREDIICKWKQNKKEETKQNKIQKYKQTNTQT